MELNFKTNSLPKIPSQLIRVALRDLELIEQDDKYEIEMAVCHVPHQGKCNVCLAGAVMAKTLNSNPNEHLSPYDFEETSELRALYLFRIGNIFEAFGEIGLSQPTKMQELIDITPYHESPETFKDDMRDLIRYLEGFGY